MYSCCAGAFKQSAWPPAAQWSAVRSYQIDNGWKIHWVKIRQHKWALHKPTEKEANIEWTISRGMTFISVLFKGHRILNLHSDIICLLASSGRSACSSHHKLPRKKNNMRVGKCANAGHYVFFTGKRVSTHLCSWCMNNRLHSLQTALSLVAMLK